jgi:hypothetical protein
VTELNLHGYAFDILLDKDQQYKIQKTVNKIVESSVPDPDPYPVPH